MVYRRMGDRQIGDGRPFAWSPICHIYFIFIVSPFCHQAWAKWRPIYIHIYIYMYIYIYIILVKGTYIQGSYCLEHCQLKKFSDFQMYVSTCPAEKKNKINHLLSKIPATQLPTKLFIILYFNHRRTLMNKRILFSLLVIVT